MVYYYLIPNKIDCLHIFISGYLIIKNGEDKVGTFMLLAGVDF